MSSASFRALAVALTFALLIWVLGGCGKGGSSAVRPSAPAERAQQQTKQISLAQALAQIDAYPVPKGVSADLWSTLTTQLKKLIVARSADGKTISSAATGANNSVADLAAVANGAGTQGTVTWTEKLWGDCSNDGQVDIADLQPIAAHYGETSAGPGSPAYLADADGDGQVSIADLQPIAQDYSMHIQGYCVYRGHWNGSSVDWETTFRPNPNAANPNWSADRPAPPAAARPPYTYTDDLTSAPDTLNVRYKVLPYGDGAAGVESSVATMPPPGGTYSVSGTVLASGVGLAGVVVTLTPGGLNATTQVDGTYSIPSVGNGNYTLTPVKSGYVFSPTNKPVTVSGANATGQDFAAATAGATYSVSGTVTLSSAGHAGTSVTLTPGGQSAVTAPDGTYTIASVANGNYTLTPTEAGYTFTPVTRAVTVFGADVTTQDFVATSSGNPGPPWPTFRQNRQNTGLSPYNGAATNAVKWTYATGAGIYGSAVVAVDGTVYVGSDDYNVYAINPSGTIKWTYAAGTYVEGCPAIASDGTVYVGAWDGNVTALDPANGTVKWQHMTGSTVESGISLGPDGTIYAGSDDDKVYALNPLDGSVKWVYSTGGYVSAAPAIGSDGTVYIGSRDNNFYALSPTDGSPKWTFNNGGTTWAFYGSAAVGSDGTIYVGNDGDSNFYALNPSDGSVKWYHTLGGGVDSSPAIGPDGTVYVGCNDYNVYAFDPATGGIKWQYATGNDVGGSPAVGADGTIYVGSYDFNIYALNPNGTEKWRRSTGDQVQGSPAISSDGTVYIGSRDFKLYAIGP